MKSTPESGPSVGTSIGLEKFHLSPFSGRRRLGAPAKKMVTDAMDFKEMKEAKLPGKVC
jgi:hypothetical protein